ncbi:MAG: TonB-dependent receptor plug domain-containing protein, partial [Pseudomonadota bacterium]
MVRFLSGASALALAVGGFHAHAQEADDVEDVIVVTGQLSEFGASKAVTPILETSRSISIETSEQFLAKGAQTVGDALEYTASVNANNFGPATRGDSYTVRGFEAAEYRDGQQTRFGSYNSSRTDVYMLEQVEILKGPASVLYGRGTPGGLVNMVSKLA